VLDSHRITGEAFFPDEPSEAWRLEQLLRAGYSIEQAEALARRGDVDLHQAVKLVDGGCHADLAARILL
jgi:hypothetical protein